MNRLLRLCVPVALAAALPGCLIASAALEPKPADYIIAAERAFAVQAQREGQWTAFRATADADAVMFVPQPVRVQDFLAGRADPPRSVAWQPGRVWVSCDGKTGVTMGPWQQPGGTAGYFTTVWQKQHGPWRWVLDRGDRLETPLAPPVSVDRRNARCTGSARLAPPPVLPRRPTDQYGSGASADGSLRWQWVVTPDGGMHFVVDLRQRGGFERVIDDRVAGAAG